MVPRRNWKAISSVSLAVLGLGVYGYFGLYRAQPATLPVSGQIVDISALGDEWETICVIGPYSNNEIALQITGLEIDIERRSRISTSDSIALLATLKGQSGYRLFEVQRRPADFADLSNTCWPNGTEFFVDAQDQLIAARIK